MRTRWSALRLSLGLVPLLGGCDALWGGFSHDNPAHCSSSANACQVDEICNAQTGLCDKLPPPTDVVMVQSQAMNCTPSGGKQACWQAYQLTSPQSTLHDVWTDGPTDVWVVGDGGLILRYDGTSWHKIPSGTQANLNSIWGPSGTDLWAVGASGTALHWNGSSWQPDTGPNLNSGVLDFCCVWGSSATDIWAAGTHTSPTQYVLSHFESGKWTRDAPTQMPRRMVPQALAGVREMGNSTVLVVGPTVLAKTDSNGYPGTITAIPVSTMPMGGWLMAGPVAITVGQNGSIQQSTNFTLANYLAVVSPTTANLRGIWGSTDGTLIAVGENGTTIASPQNLWSTEAPVTNAHLNRVSGTDLGNVWAVGESGTILTRTLN